jgi:outer membrane protein OmpA-like peptidoglycan-associated protein
MVKPLPKPSRGTVRVRYRASTSPTPAGVGVIIAMAVFFVIGGLGISAFVVWKAIGANGPVRNSNAGEQIKPLPTSSAASDGEVGVEHPTRNARSVDSAPAPQVIADGVEQERMRQEVLKRIDLMRALTNTDKDKLYAQVERAQGFTKIAIIPFAENRTIAGADQIDGLVKSLNEPGLRKLIADPTVILFMVGFADKQGEEGKNVEVSRSRAESVVKALKETTDLGNVMHAVGMGGQDLFDQSNLEKNRVVEVWAAQP